MISNLKIIPEDITLSLSWTNGKSNANAIMIKWMTPNAYGGWQGANSVEVPSGQTSWVIGNLINGQIYNIQVSQVHFISSTEGSETPQFGAPVPIVKPVIS